MNRACPRGRTGKRASQGRRGQLLARLGQSRRVVLCGLGNIGSRMALELPLLGVKRMLLVDPDRVSPRNLRTCWAFAQPDVGRHKVDVIAERLRQVFPRLDVEAAPCALNRLGLARLRDWLPGIFVGALDSRRARMELAESALWLGAPVVDLGIPGGALPAARVQVVWWAMRKIDLLNAWSAEDWNLLGRSQPCGRTGGDEGARPLASSLSGAAAASLGVAAVRKLLAGDGSDIGWEIRTELVRFSTVRRALPRRGLSPLDPREEIRLRPRRRTVKTLGDLVREAERRLGRGARLLLNRDMSPRFLCSACGALLAGGPVEWRACPKCANAAVATRPLGQLSRDELEDDAELAHLPVACLGVSRDLVRVTDRAGRARCWLQYVQEAP